MNPALVGHLVRVRYRSGAHPRVREAELVGVLIRTHLNRPTITLSITNGSGHCVFRTLHSSRIITVEAA